MQSRFLKLAQWILAPLLASRIGACARPEIVEGGLYSTANDDDSYSVLKVLKVDAKGVHVRIYSNRFESALTAIDASALYLAGIDHKPEESLGLGHLPVSHEHFEAWKPRFVQREGVTEEELDGYRVWLEEGGGFF